MRASYSSRATFIGDASHSIDAFGWSVRAWGLDPDVPEDVERWRFIAAERNLEVEYWEPVPQEECDPDAGPEPDGGRLGPQPQRRRDLTVTFFGLARERVPPGTRIPVLNAASVAASAHENASTRREALRVLIDGVRADPRPLAIVAFAPDRTDECAGLITSALFADQSLLAERGSVQFLDLMDASEQPIQQPTFPDFTVRRGSFVIDADFGAKGSLRANSSCVLF